TTPIQALGLMNNSFVLRQAHHFAERVRKEAGERMVEQIKAAYRLALSRSAREEEIRQAAALAQEHGMESVCRALLKASEFADVRRPSSEERAFRVWAKNPRGGGRRGVGRRGDPFHVVPFILMESPRGIGVRLFHSWDPGGTGP